MAAKSQAPGAVLTNPEWLAHRYDAQTDAAQFRRVARADHASFPFLTDEYIGARPLAVLPFAEAAAGAPTGRLHFIFHSAFCASTMLVRALDHEGVAMGLSEPVILNDIVGVRRRGAEPRQVARALDGAMRLLARPFAAGEAVVVKPSNVLNPLIEATLTIRPDAKAVFLFAPLPVFLASVARKGMWCRLWARELLEGYLRDSVVDLGFTPDDYFRQTDLQVAAVGWLAQHALFPRLAQKFGPGRVRTLDSETLLAQPQEAVAALGAHFELGATNAQLAAMATGPAFTRHSKFGSDFSAEMRAREQRTAAQTYGEEIEKVAHWAEVVGGQTGIAPALPHQLIV